MKLSILQQNVYGTEEAKVDLDTGWEGLEAYAPLFTLRIRGGGGGCFLPKMKYLGSSLPANIGDDHKQVKSN